MVKIHCDRCNKEIKDKYYTINIYEYDTNPKYDYCADRANSYSNSRNDILIMLNATKMYCKDCADKIEAFISST